MTTNNQGDKSISRTLADAQDYVERIALSDTGLGGFLQMTPKLRNMGGQTMKKYRQRITGVVYGDCFRACMATLLQLPPEVLPNDFSQMWHHNWQNYLSQFGIALSYSNRSKQPIWLPTPWIASVKSLNYEGVTHAILMHQGNVVLHDPSNKKRYKTGQRLDSDTVISGEHLLVADSSKLHNLEQYRKMFAAPSPNTEEAKP